MAQKWANNATTTLATDLAPGALSMSVLPGAGVKFPTLAAGDFVQITLIKANGSLEIVRATAKTNDTFTIARAQEGTQALQFLAGERVEARWTAISPQTLQAAIDAASALAGTKVAKSGDTMTGDLYIRATSPASPWIHLCADGYVFTHIRAANGGMEWYNSAINARNMLLDDAGTITNRGGVYAGGRIQGGDLLSNGIVYSGGGASQLTPDGNVYGSAWGGYLSNWLNNQLAAKQNDINNRTPIRNAGWNNYGYVVTNSVNSMQIWWDGRVQVQVDGSYQGYMWTSGNFNPGAKANYDAMPDTVGTQIEIGPASRPGTGAIDAGSPWVMCGIRVGNWVGPSADSAGSIYPRFTSIRQR
ncbi:hypothetical protein M0D69_14005 [Caballeronia sp. SEWSISQ10-4 2]|uniref:hypothetical protein n=1 Tax=Caballeronia sp. SEWSISQ10-4 2 TaxID=2937438 RepID=UPI0026549D33|nr:hypothetical protein [Caballeronia sp. SEWSISQ10-4 2]MDN7179108.1 hypothetical protein [Caballeronia sp. SEWSISQ10-4 2]